MKTYIETRSDILILRPPVLTQPEVIVLKNHVQNVFFKANNESDTKNDKLKDAIQTIRDAILIKPVWSFEGSFKNFEVDDNLLQLFKMLIGGCNPHIAKSNIISKVASVLFQVVEQVILTDRQVRIYNLFCLFVCLLS